MILEIYLLLQIVMFTFFTTAFFFKKEFLWAGSVLLNIVLVGSTTNIYKLYPVLTSSTEVVTAISYIDVPTMALINVVFGVISAIIGIIDWYDKHSFDNLGDN